MAEELATYTLSPIFRTLKQSVEGLRDQILLAGSVTLRRELGTSMRSGDTRWYRSGTAFRSLREEFTTDGDKKAYRLWPTAVSKRGAPYPLFGEYGTGLAGRASGGPAPVGYSWGSSKGIRARRYARTAVQQARPQIDRMAGEQAKRFAANMTR